MKKLILLSLVLSLFMVGCANRVLTTTQYDAQKYPDIGYISFKLENVYLSTVAIISGIQGRYDLAVENMDTKESYVFMLNDEKPPSFGFYIGPFRVYQNYFEQEKFAPLKILPLPQGKYRLKYLYEKSDRNSRSWFANDEQFEVQKDKMTYIGTYSITPKFFLLFPYGVKVESKDDGLERATQMGMQEQFVKRICKIKN